MIVFVFGCSSKVGYHIGIVTSHVAGTIGFENKEKRTNVFLLVKKYIRTFYENSQGYLHHVNASIQFPNDKGEYEVSFDADVDKIDLLFISPGHLIESKSFSRTLGVGSYEYNVTMRPDSSFKDSFYLSIKPSLSEFILEPRYKMPQSQQMFLGNWFKRIEDTYTNN